MKQGSESVELRPAYTWTCPECSAENFEPAPFMEASPEELEELREAHGIDPEEEGAWLLAPYEVECWQCKSSFPTTHWAAEE